MIANQPRQNKHAATAQLDFFHKRVEQNLVTRIPRRQFDPFLTSIPDHNSREINQDGQFSNPNAYAKTMEMRHTDQKWKRMLSDRTFETIIIVVASLSLCMIARCSNDPKYM